MSLEVESERDGGVGGEGLGVEVYRVKELIMASGRVEVVEGGGCVKMGAGGNSVKR